MPVTTKRLSFFAALLVASATALACSDSKSTSSPTPDAGDPQDAEPEDASSDRGASEASTDGGGADGSTEDAAATDASDASADTSTPTEGGADAAISACPTGARSQGPLQPTATANGAGIGSVSWSSPTNARVTDDFYSSINGLASNQITNYLIGTAFGFNVPAAATITGVVVTIERHSTLVSTVDQEVRVVRTGVVAGDNKASASSWSLADDIATYGAQNDLWGLALGPNDVNSAAFGAAVAAKNSNAAAASPQIDQMRVTVHYTCP